VFKFLFRIDMDVLRISVGKYKRRLFCKDDGSLYKKDKTRGRVEYLKCISKGCKCRAKYTDGVKFERTNKVRHNHKNYRARAEYEIAYSEMKEMILTDKRPIRQIYNSIVRKLSPKSCARLTWKGKRRQLQRVRHSQMPPCPDLQTMINLLEFDDVVYEQFGKMQGVEFYQGTINNDLVIFANMQLVSELDQEFDMYCDGTFNVTPFRTHQLLIVMAELQGKPRPISYVIMTGRKRSAYEAVFTHLKESVFCFDNKQRGPKSVTTDFEIGLRRALTTIFPNISIYGCNFHQSQALRRKALSLKGLAVNVRNKNQKHHRILKMFMRLSLLPIERIDIGYESLKEFINSSQQLARDFAPFMKYFDTTWMHRFPKEEWCVSDRARRTNNNIEGYNMFVKQSIRRNPGPWDFLDSLLNLAYDASINLFSDQNLNNRQPQKDRSKITVALKENLHDLNNNNITELLFLKRMAQL
jgi:hypothetical protein